jgi:tRNA-dihydrouridine synthase B
VLRDHVHELYEFYGEHTGLRVARKHISWYTKGLSGSAHFRHRMNRLETPDTQLAAVDEFFAEQSQRGTRLHYIEGLAA